MKARPVIGIICCTRPFGDETAQVVIDRYVESVTRHADCAALLIPARPDLMSAGEVADRIDGLLLTGSPSNVAPSRYGQSGPGSGPFDEGRDAMTAALVEAIIARAAPVFGVCRGFQELNVILGGTLRTDLGAAGRDLVHHAPDGADLAKMFAHDHRVALVPEGVLARSLGTDALVVNSVHYQGVDRLAAPLRIEASAPDGVVEAASARIAGAPVLGVQWHPEWQSDHNAASRAFFTLFGRTLRGDHSPWEPA